MKTIKTQMEFSSAPWVTAGIHNAEDIANFIANYRGEAARIVHLLTDADPRTADPFLEGARLAMRKFSAANRGHKVTGRSTCSFAEMKDGDQPTTFFILADGQAITAQGPLIAAVQWAAMQELMSHPNKDKPVYLLADEASNFKIHNLGGLLTTARGYGVRIHLFLQNFSGFVITYGRAVLNTLISEAEIVQILPGSREDDVLSFVRRRLGDQSLVVPKHRGGYGKGVFEIDGIDYAEEGKPLATEDEARRLGKGILFVRRNKPAMVDIPRYAAVHPFRDMVDPDPFYPHGKPYRLRISHRLQRRFRALFGKAWRKFSKPRKLKRRG